MTRVHRFLLSCSVLLVFACGTAWAQAWPAKPIRLIVPWPPGGVTDVLARAVAQKMGESLGHQMVIDNRPGAGGTIGVALAVKAPADGYTLVATDIPSHAISATLYTRLPYDVLRDLEPIAVLAGSPAVLVTHPGLNVKTLPEFIQLARSQPGKLAYGSSGNGSITHLAIERLLRMTGLQLIHVPFKGTIPAVTSVLSGDSVIAFGTIPGVAPHAKSGKLVMLGASFARRFAQIPDVPAIAETVAGYDMGFYTGLFAPGGTPKELIERIHVETAKALADPKVKEIYAASAAESGSMTPGEFREYLAGEVRAWGEVVRAVGLKID